MGIGPWYTGTPNCILIDQESSFSKPWAVHKALWCGRVPHQRQVSQLAKNWRTEAWSSSKHFLESSRYFYWYFLEKILFATSLKAIRNDLKWNRSASFSIVFEKCLKIRIQVFGSFPRPDLVEHEKIAEKACSETTSQVVKLCFDRAFRKHVLNAALNTSNHCVIDFR